MGRSDFVFFGGWRGGWEWTDAARVRRDWAEGADGIKSGAGGWGEALAGEKGCLGMPVNVSAPGFGVFYQYIV